MKSLCLVSLLTLFCVPLWSQSFSKQLLFPDTSASAFRFHQDIFPTVDGGYLYAAGEYNLDGAVLLCKFTADGALTWATELYLYEDYEEEGWFVAEIDLIETPSGGAMVHLEIQERETSIWRTHIVKLDAEGTLQFSFELPVRPFGSSITTKDNQLYRIDDQYLLAGTKYLDSLSSVVISLVAWEETGVITESKAWKVGHFDRLVQPSISLGQNSEVQLSYYGYKFGDQDTITDGTILFSVDVNDWETASCSFHPEQLLINDIASDENGWYYIFNLDNTVLIDTSTIAHFDYEQNLKWSENMHNVSGLVPMEDALLVRREDTLDMVTLAALSKQDGSLTWNSVLWDFISYPTTYKPVELTDGGLLWMGYNAAISTMIKMDAQGQVADCNSFSRCDLETLPPSPLPEFEPIEITSISIPDQIPITITSRFAALESVPYCPDFNFTADFLIPDTVCQGDVVTTLPLKESSVLPISLEWNVSPTIAGNLTVDTLAFVAEETQPYTIRHEVHLLGCRDTTTQNIQVLDGPALALPSDTSVCAGDSLLLDSELDPSRYALEWQNGDSTQTIVASTAGVYWLSAVSRATSCENTDTTRLSILAPPSVDLPPTASFCEGETLTIDLPPTGLAFRWNTGDTLAAITISQAGTYQLTVTDGQGCSTTDSLQAVVLPAPQFWHSPDTTFCPGLPPLLQAEALSEDKLQWLWPDGSNSDRFRPDTPGTFPLVVSNAACSDTVLIQVEAGDCQSDIFVPSAFSPNDDGRNDLFKAYGPDIVPMRLQIYDRWGGLLYEGKGAEAQWDGTFADKLANPGQYVYVLQYRDQLSLEVYQKAGQVVLLR